MSDPRLLDESAERQFRRRLLLWKVTAGVMTAALVAVAVLWAGSRPMKPETPAVIKVVRPPEVTTSPAQARADSPKWLDGQLLAHLKQWVQDHPKEYLVGIRMYEGAMLCMSDPVLRSQAKGEIDRLERVRKTAAQEALEQAKKEAGEFARDGNYDLAVASLDRVPEQFKDLIADGMAFAKAQLRAEAEQKVRAVLAVARQLGESNKPEDGLAALERLNITYTPMLAEIEKVHADLLARQKQLADERTRQAVAAAEQGIWKLLDAVEVAVAKGDVAGVERPLEAALPDETLKPAEGLLKSAIAVCKLLPGVKARPKEWKPTNPDEAIAAALLAFTAKDAANMEIRLGAAAGHALHEHYCSKLWGLKFGAEKVLTVGLGGDVTMDLVLIRPGSFMMGSDKADNEKPVHKVTITKPFYMGKFEVTQEQWKALTDENPSKFKGDKNPVEHVSWDECQAFLRKLAEKAPGRTFRLPTEAEWEYACRAGSTTAFCYGDDEGDLTDYAWYRANAGNKTQPVGGKKPNAWGLYDMHGNVGEWCLDWHGSYAGTPEKDPAGPTFGESRAVRGASWVNDPAFLRTAYRDVGPPGNRGYIGLRVVCAVGVD